jgi:hypothetical protein
MSPCFVGELLTGDYERYERMKKMALEMENLSP